MYVNYIKYIIWLTKSINMKYCCFTLGLVFLFCFNISAQAQPEQLKSKGVDGTDMYYIVDMNSLEEIKSLFSFPETNLCLIDFSFSTGDITDLELKSAKGVVYEESLEGLPKDSIYEFDLNDFEKGTYTLIIHSSEETLTREVTIQ